MNRARLAEVEAMPGKIPTEIVVDISGLELGDQLRIVREVLARELGEALRHVAERSLLPEGVLHDDAP